MQATVFKKLFTTLTKAETISSVPCNRVVSQYFVYLFLLGFLTCLWHLSHFPSPTPSQVVINYDLDNDKE